MTRSEVFAAVALVTILALVSAAQTDVRREGGPPRIVMMPPQVQPPAGPGPIPFIAMREYAEQLRARARQAQELADWLRRQADEVDQMVMRQMDRGGGPQEMGQVPRELRELKEALGRAEREGRQQEAAELRERALQLRERFQPMPSGERMEVRQEMKKQVERLRDEARKAKEQGRMEQSERIWKEADRLEQRLREQGEREGREPGKAAVPEVQDILKAAEQAEREGRMDDARRQREKAEIVARQLQEQKREGPKQPGPQLKDELMRGLEDLKREIGRLWQAVNEMRNRPQDGRPA